MSFHARPGQTERAKRGESFRGIHEHAPSGESARHPVAEMQAELVDDTAVITHGRVIVLGMSVPFPEQGGEVAGPELWASAGSGEDGPANRHQDRWDQSFFDQAFGVAGKPCEQ